MPTAAGSSASSTTALSKHLVGLAVKLQQARGLVDSDPAAAGVLIDEMRGDVQESLDRLRSLAQRIHPPQLEAGGLPAALRSAAASAGVRVRIDVGANGVYPQEVSATVYLCIVAAFERLVTGTTAAIGIREENGTVAFEIVAEDAGVDPADAHLAAIRDRVEALGGRLTITAVSGGGTRIAGSLPTRETLVALGEVEDHGLDPTVNSRLPGQAELEEDRVDHLLDRSLGQDQRFGDGGVVLPLGHLAKHVALARRQLVERRVSRCARSPRRARRPPWRSITEPPSATVRIAATSCSTSSTRSLRR